MIVLKYIITISIINRLIKIIQINFNNLINSNYTPIYFLISISIYLYLNNINYKFIKDKMEKINIKNKWNIKTNINITDDSNDLNLIKEIYDEVK